MEDPSFRFTFFYAHAILRLRHERERMVDGLSENCRMVQGSRQRPCRSPRSVPNLFGGCIRYHAHKWPDPVRQAEWYREISVSSLQRAEAERFFNKWKEVDT